MVDQFAAVDLVIAGVLYFTDCNFTTGLTLSGCKFEKPIEMEHKAIVMEDCVFEGAVSFVQLSCKRDLWIIDCSFLAEVGFQAVKLSAPVIISKCTFISPPKIFKVEFLAGVLWEGITGGWEGEHFWEIRESTFSKLFRLTMPTQAVKLNIIDCTFGDDCDAVIIWDQRSAPMGQGVCRIIGSHHLSACSTRDPRPAGPVG